MVGLAVSEKPFGIVTYFAYYPLERKWFWSEMKRSNTPEWHYLCSNYYKTKKAQMMAFFDLNVKYKNYKFIAFSNKGKHPMDVFGKMINLEEI